MLLYGHVGLDSYIICSILLWKQCLLVKNISPKEGTISPFVAGSPCTKERLD